MPRTATATNELKARAQKLFNSLKDCQDRELIQQLCKAEREYLESKYSHNSLGTKLSQHYNQLFHSILLTQSNSFEDKTRLGKPIRRHLFFKHCGFSSQDWQQRNDTSDTPEKIINAPAIDPKPYLDKAAELLLSEDPYQLGVGLIAATGCRPIEILLTGDFASVQGETYQIRFSGQAKKRGQKPTFNRPVLFPADFLIKSLRKFRKLPEIAELKIKAQEIINELTTDEKSSDEVENELKKRIGDARGASLWRKTSESFKDVIPPKFGEKYVNNQALRAAFGTLVVARDVDGSDAAKILYFGRAIGHIAKDEEAKKSDLTALSTTLGYGAYYVPKNVEVPFAPTPEKHKEKVGTVRAFDTDIKRVKEYQEKYEFENQQEVIRKALDALYELMENPKMIVKIESPTDSQDSGKDEKQKDWSDVPSEELKGRKTPGTANEKLDRAVSKIMYHNDYVATSNEDRWQINLTSLRNLSGCRFESVRKYLDEKRVMIDDHNAKYGLSDYHNQQHGKKKGIKIEDVIQW